LFCFKIFIHFLLRETVADTGSQGMTPTPLPHSPAWLHSFPIYVVLRVDVASTLRNFPPKRDLGLKDFCRSM
jgi:hypothetical protein